MLLKLSWKYIKNNKKRTKAIIISIIISTLLLTVIGVLGYNLKKRNVERIMDVTGDMHVTFTNQKGSFLNKIKNNNQIKKVGKSYLFGNVDFSERLSMLYYDKNSLDMLDMKLTKGDYPKRKNEIIMSKHIFDKMNLSHIGEKVNLKFRKYKVNAKNVLSALEEKEFVVSGILNESILTNRSILITDQYIESEYGVEDLKYDFLVKFNNDINIENKSYDIAEKVGIEQENIKINHFLLEAKGYDLKSLIPYIVIIGIILLATILIIYSIFYMSINDRIRQLALVACIGVTNKQMKKLILYEGLFLSVIGIPIGVILGSLIGYSINFIDILNNIDISIPVKMIMLVTLISFISVMLPIFKVIKIVTRKSAIELVNYVGRKSHKTKRRSRLSSFFSKNTKLAYLNLLRNKKRTFITICSLSISVILFITFLRYSEHMKIDHLVYTKMGLDSDITISKKIGSQAKLDKIAEKLDGIEEIKDYYTIGHRPYSMKLDDKKMRKELIEKIRKYSEEDRILGDMYLLDGERIKSLNDYLVKGNINADEMENSPVVILKEDKEDLNYKIGDEVTVEIINSKGEEIKQDVVIGGIVRAIPGKLSAGAVGPKLVMHEEMYRNIEDEKIISKICIKSKQDSYKKLEKNIEELVANKDIEVTTIGEVREELEEYNSFIKIIVVGLVLLISIISIINFKNTLTASILARKKEIGVIQAIGITRKQLKQMVYTEGLSYAVISIIISNILGIFLSTHIIQLITETKVTYKFMPSIILLDIIFIGIVFINTSSILNKLERYSVIEKIQSVD
ncbi:ABC transporter permease [Dethiothermospora halolimnae]|uniref:ABC transporter permease n=1 Tax=Dethiothermospora halolimnae TaxID=3114390 RepID=UPI003CCC1D24